MNTEQIRKLNDEFRQSIFTSAPKGEIFMTSGVDMLSPVQKISLLNKVSTFNDFDTERNDPYGEHDFGSIEFNKTKYFFKIDYYNKDMTSGSVNPANPQITRRVLTVMRADEY